MHASAAPTGSIPGVCSKRAPPSERGCGLHTHQVRGRGSEVRDDRGRRAGDLDGLGRGWGVVGLCTRQPRQQGRSREFVPNELHRPMARAHGGGVKVIYLRCEGSEGGRSRRRGPWVGRGGAVHASVRQKDRSNIKATWRKQ